MQHSIIQIVLLEQKQVQLVLVVELKQETYIVQMQQLLQIH